MCVVRSAVLFATLAAASMAVSARGLEDKAAVVTVLAESGTPLRELKAADFVVKENGKKLEVTDAQLSTDTLSVALLLDVSQHTRGIAPTTELRRAASTFIKTIQGANPDAQIAIWQYAIAPSVTVNFTSKPEELDAALGRIFFGSQSAAALLETLERVGGQLATRPGSRRAIVSVDFDSPEGGSEQMMQRAGDGVAKSGATLWAVSVRASGASGTSNATREQVLAAMTKASGGKRYSIVDASALDAKLKGIAASLTSQYLVTFNRVSDGPVKTLTFETAKGGKVQATPFMR